MTIEKIFEEYLQNDNSAFFYTPPIYRNSFSYLFYNPCSIITAGNSQELLDSFDIITCQIKSGKAGFGYLVYEAGYFFEQKFEKLRDVDSPLLLKFCFFDDKNIWKIKSSELDFVSGGFEKNYEISGLKFNRTREEFVNDIKSIKNFIAEGDTYQVNYTIKSKFRFDGSYSKLFKSLIFNQSAGYSAYINDGNSIIISISPELFFSIRNRKITAKPMKGTIKRGKTIFEDNYNLGLLKIGDKFKAENLMILDLLRNDLGRIAEFNSVKVAEPFRVEKYESLFQLISEVKAVLKKDISLKEIFAGLFPCGSITGAPKIRTMEIIRELEGRNRGLYTGTIGLILKEKLVFNIAIRTLVIDKETNAGELGIGSGITWDSRPEDEYNETLLKSRFIIKPDEYFELIETMLYENGNIFLLDRHIDRIKDAASYFLFIFKEKELRKELALLLLQSNKDNKYRIRLSLNKWGKFNLKTTDFQQINKPVKIFLSGKKVSTKNRFQYFKTTQRDLYNSEYNNFAEMGFFDVIFFNEMNFLAEGATTNIFIRIKDNWLTPSLDCGILPGVFRNYFIETNHSAITETTLTYEDLLNADELVLTNSVRGVIKADQLFLNSTEEKDFSRSNK